MTSDDERSEDWRRNLSQHLAKLEEMAAGIPGGKLLTERLRPIRELLLEQRAPRFALVGRRGSGKSSLINALFGSQVAEVGHEKAQTGRAEWFTFGSERGALEILDTRGFQEGSRPDGDESRTALTSVSLALKKRCPDAVLFLIKAKEADAAVDADLQALKDVCTAIEKAHGAKVPFVAVVTQCDELEPRNTPLDGADDEDRTEKLERVALIEQNLDERLKADPFLRDRLVKVLGICAYQSWRRDGTVRDDSRWRLEVLVEFLIRELPQEARVELVRVSMVRKLQKEIANTLIHTVAAACAAVAATPIPIADLALITPLQAAMITGIAYVSGQSVDLRGVRDFLAAMGLNVGVGLVLREAARALVKLVPVAGNSVSAAVAYAGTVAVGRGAVAYFIDKRSGPEAKREYANAIDNPEKPKE